MMELKIALAQGIAERISDACFNGPEPGEGAPHILNVSFPGLRGEVLLHALEADGIYVSTGSACAAPRHTASPVLAAMGLPPERMESAIRFSLSPLTTPSDIDETLRALERHVPRLRRVGRKKEMERLLLVKYAEIHLKGLNRPFFERRLVAALRRAAGSDACRVTHRGSRCYLTGYDPADEDRLVEAVRHVLGVHSVCPAVSCDRDMETIARTVSVKRGNYIAYFPSYAYMKAVHDVFHGMYPDVRTAVQHSDMDEREREAFLERFDAGNEETLVGFCVLGGIYSEGIDLRGDRLIGTVIVGVGLPQINMMQDILREYYDALNGNGFAYAYRYPGMNKILQAAGRVIRSAGDRGVVVLVDDRYTTPQYLALFPDHWKGHLKVSGPDELSRRLASFWSK